MVSYLCPLIPAGVSVCLRYLTNTVENRLFTVSPSRMPLQVTVNQLGYYTLRFNSYGYNTLYMKPSIRFWSNIGPDIWSRVCFTLDSMKNVAQAFSGSNISIRMLLPYQVRTEECILNQIHLVQHFCSYSLIIRLDRQMNPAMFHDWKWLWLQVYRQFSVLNLIFIMSLIYICCVCVFVCVCSVCLVRWACDWISRFWRSVDRRPDVGLSSQL